MMETMEASIEITRMDRILSSVKVIIPVWTRQEDGLIRVMIALFGIETVAINEDDVEVAVKEAVQCFCLAAERHGNGLEQELQALGWEQSADHSTFNVHSRIPMFESIMNTGNFQAFQFSMAA